MSRWMWNPIFRREHFTLGFYKKHYECIIPLLFMIGDCAWMATSTYHGFKHYDIIVFNASRDRHEEYDQFLKFYSHQWMVLPEFRNALSKPRRDLFELYTEMEKRWKGLETKREECDPGNE